MGAALAKLPCIVGPTGVGKSAIAVGLAKRLGAEILSVDAFQFYRGLPIGTNYPETAWLREVPHHFIACREPQEAWSAPRFAQEALNLLREKERQGVPMVVVGGSGFYLRALLEGAPEGEAPDPDLRAMVMERYETLGPEAAHAWLAERDPQTAQRLHPNDAMRVRRALEKTFAPPPTDTLAYEPWGASNALVLGLEMPREKLDERLKHRSEAMWRGGLLDETRGLLARKVPEGAPVWGAIGYKEAADYLAGHLTEAAALERVYRRTRQYAKRQGTWFRHHHQTEWVNLDSFPDPEAVVLYLARRLGGQST